MCCVQITQKFVWFAIDKNTAKLIISNPSRRKWRRCGMRLFFVYAGACNGARNGQESMRAWKLQEERLRQDLWRIKGKGRKERKWASWKTEELRRSEWSVGSKWREYHLPSSDGREEYDGEFDPGSERTLAARFKHASRTVDRCLHWLRVANGWVTRRWSTFGTGIACGNTG